MRLVVPATLLIAALIHALPIVGVLGASQLEALYGVALPDPNLALLLRHRALLFGLLAAFLAYAAFVPALHRVALLGALVSVISFLWLAWLAGPTNPALSKVVWADVIALIALLVGGAAHALRSNSA
jgi:hypothetical protein